MKWQPRSRYAEERNPAGKLELKSSITTLMVIQLKPSFPFHFRRKVPALKPFNATKGRSSVSVQRFTSFTRYIVHSIVVRRHIRENVFLVFEFMGFVSEHHFDLFRPEGSAVLEWV